MGPNGSQGGSRAQVMGTEQELSVEHGARAIYRIREQWLWLIAHGPNSVKSVQPWACGPGFRTPGNPGDVTTNMAPKNKNDDLVPLPTDTMLHLFTSNVRTALPLAYGAASKTHTHAS